MDADNIHPSMKRVFALAEQAGISNKTYIASKLNATPQTLDNWSRRGISMKGAMAASKVFGVECGYILDGKIDSGKTEREIIESQTLKASELKVVAVLKTVRSGGLEAMVEADIHSFETKPYNLSNDGFMLLVAGRNMLPELQPNDYAVVETNIETDDLKDGDMVVVQPHGRDCGIIKQVIIGDSIKDVYLSHTNKEIPNWEAAPLTNFDLIGKVVGNFRFYR
jgi:SOS-response transcriptional repressor LexA